MLVVNEKLESQVKVAYEAEGALRTITMKYQWNENGTAMIFHCTPEFLSDLIHLINNPPRK